MNNNFISYELFLPLHSLWRGYISELLGLPPRPLQPSPDSPRIPKVENMQTKLVKADFHGSIVSGSFSFQSVYCLRFTKTPLVVRNAKNASLVGVGGIVIQETENTFKVVTPKNQLKGKTPGL